MIRIRQKARVVFAEEPIAIQRNAIVCPISKLAWEAAQKVQRMPRDGQQGDDFKKSIRAHPIVSVADHGHGVELMQRQTCPSKQRLPLGRLYCRQPDAPMAVMADQEPRPAIAQLTYAVEQEHRLALLEQRRG
ncbi:hypothetical protein TU81_25630 [Pseudomonas lini]|nr:hypothetical protein TU81_25630 [Pseudomonas lini]